MIPLFIVYRDIPLNSSNNSFVPLDSDEGRYIDLLFHYHLEHLLTSVKQEPPVPPSLSVIVQQVKYSISERWLLTTVDYC